MTPTQIEDQFRLQYNAVNDTYFTQAMVFNWIYFAEYELATKALCVQATHTTTTVASQTAYTYPTNTIAIKRVEYQGVPLKKVSFRENDAVTLTNPTTVVTGRPLYYSQWGGEIRLQPTPVSANTLSYYTYKEPSVVTANTTLEVPQKFHPHIVNYCLEQAYAKDQNLQMASYYGAKWQANVQEVMDWQAKEKRTDGFAVVQSEDQLESTVLGAV